MPSSATPPPIDPRELQRVLEPTVAGARTLPGEAYTSQPVYDWERQRLFDAGWVCIGRADIDTYPSVGALRTANADILLSRDESGVLRGFYNACRHRGHELMTPGAWKPAPGITCPYHAWTYAMDGTLRSAPRFGDVPGFVPADHPLVPVRVESWHGWIFMNASGSAPPLAAWLGNLGPLVERWEPARLFVGASHQYVVEANWKTITENFHECHHCPNIHPQLSAVQALESGGNVPHDGFWIGGPMTLRPGARTMSLSGESKGVPVRNLAAEDAARVHYCGLFPNLLVSLHPDYVMTHRMDPLGPERTRVECTWLFPPEAKARPGFDPAYAAEFWDITNRQDWQACESVARGIRSGGFRQGPMTWKEDGVHAFMAMVARAYLEGAPVPAPSIAARPGP